MKIREGTITLLCLVMLCGILSSIPVAAWTCSNDPGSPPTCPAGEHPELYIYLCITYDPITGECADGYCEWRCVTDECSTDGDCDDGDPCTIDKCYMAGLTGGFCTHDPMECPEGQWCEEGECVPEASTLVLFAVGLLFLTGYVRLKRRKTK